MGVSTAKEVGRFGDGRDGSAKLVNPPLSGYVGKRMHKLCGI